jgi:hypothetical protein
VYSPLIGFLATPKQPAPGALENATPTSGGATATAYLNNFAVNPSIGATATVARSAAAEARDPSPCPPASTATRSPSTASRWRFGQAGEFAELTFFATDSRFTDPPRALAVVAEGALNGANDLEMAFESETALSADSSGTPLDASAIEKAVRQAFMVSNGVAQLSWFQLFSAFYMVDRSVQFSDGANAGADHVPGPATAVLICLGCPCS